MRSSGSSGSRRFDPGRRDRIIDACLDVVAVEGVAGVSHRKVAEAANVQLGSMTYHFRGMDDLLYEAFTRFATTVSDGFERRMAEASDAPAARRAVVDLVVQDVLTDTRNLILTHELYILAARKPQFRRLTDEWMARSRAALERHFDPITSRILDAMIEGLSIHRSLDLGNRDPEEVSEAVGRIIAGATQAP